ncbi:MAG: hypothetical protein JWO74_4097 [Solirubrobacterales bacterium]|nr:hypothetical protein [Solirubrobacterales bacterium]
MRTSALFGAVIALAAVCALALVGVAVHEINYASSHPHQYGPAKVIAWGASASALLGVAVGLLAAAMLHQTKPSR